jgi:hypothetical protein
MALFSEQIDITIKALAPMFDQLRDTYRRIVEMSEPWKRIAQEIRRAEAKRVHTAYGRKRKARQKRRKR